MTKKPK